MGVVATFAELPILRKVRLLNYRPKDGESSAVFIVPLMLAAGKAVTPIVTDLPCRLELVRPSPWGKWTPLPVSGAEMTPVPNRRSDLKMTESDAELAKTKNIVEMAVDFIRW